MQGVGYRAWAAHQAFTRGLAGFVRNRRDGSVEALVVGTADAVEAMLEACRQGPPAAVVVHIEQREAGAELLRLIRPGELFSMLPTV